MLTEASYFLCRYVRSKLSHRLASSLAPIPAPIESPMTSMLTSSCAASFWKKLSATAFLSPDDLSSALLSSLFFLSDLFDVFSPLSDAFSRVAGGMLRPLADAAGVVSTLFFASLFCAEASVLVLLPLSVFPALPAFPALSVFPAASDFPVSAFSVTSRLPA